MKTLILTDNAYALDLARELDVIYGNIAVFQSPKGPLADVPRLSVKTQIDERFIAVEAPAQADYR